MIKNVWNGLRISRLTIVSCTWSLKNKWFKQLHLFGTVKNWIVEYFEAYPLKNYAVSEIWKACNARKMCDEYSQDYKWKFIWFQGCERARTAANNNMLELIWFNLVSLSKYYDTYDFLLVTNYDNTYCIVQTRS